MPEQMEGSGLRWILLHYAQPYLRNQIAAPLNFRTERTKRVQLLPMLKIPSGILVSLDQNLSFLSDFWFMIIEIVAEYTFAKK